MRKLPVNLLVGILPFTEFSSPLSTRLLYLHLYDKNMTINKIPKPNPKAMVSWLYSTDI